MKAHEYRHVVKAVYQTPWAILPATFDEILAILRSRVAGELLEQVEIESRLAAAAETHGPRAQGRGAAGRGGTVAVIPVYGVISQRQNLMSRSSGGTSIEGLTADLRDALADQSVDAIVFDIDSPGGSVDGVDELAAEIRAARSQKPIVAVANTMAASAAYWLASAAREVVCTPSGVVGSIGVLAAHDDLSKQNEAAGVKTTLISAGKYKTEGNELEPLSPEALATIQDHVDAYFGMFTSAVARGRGVGVDEVRSGYGEGRIVMAKPALAAGMIDRIDTLDATVKRVAREAVTGQTTGAAALADDADENEPTTDTRVALASGLPFAQRLELVAAQADELVAHARRRRAMRADDGGRSLSAATREQLSALHASLGELLSEATPRDRAAAQAALRARRIVAIELAQYGQTPTTN
jgi:capsid assembly protease